MPLLVLLPLHVWLDFLTVVSVSYLSFLSYVKILQGKLFNNRVKDIDLQLVSVIVHRGDFSQLQKAAQP